MWPFKSKFIRALRKQALIMRTDHEVVSDDDRTMSSIDIDFHGFYSVSEEKLGILCTLILAQANCEGAARVKLHYGKNKMTYTIKNTDYDMVPCTSPMDVDMCRALVRESKTQYNEPGALSIQFSDRQLVLTITHHSDSKDPYIEITGFSGEMINSSVNAA